MEEDSLIWDEKSEAQHQWFTRFYLEEFNQSLQEIECV